MKLLCQSRSVTPRSLWHTYTCTYICIYMLYAVIHNGGGGGSNSEVTCDLKISGAEQQQYRNERETAVLLFFLSFFFCDFYWIIWSMNITLQRLTHCLLLFQRYAIHTSYCVEWADFPHWIHTDLLTYYGFMNYRST